MRPPRLVTPGPFLKGPTGCCARGDSYVIPLAEAGEQGGNALVKFDLHGKSELQMALAQWDFSEWAPPALD